MIKKKENIYKMVYISELFDTQAFIVPIKTSFYLSFFVQLSDISIYKFIMVFITFLCEIPLGYFSDKYGDKITVTLSYIMNIISLLLMILIPNNMTFIFCNILFGFSNALISGAKNTYLLKVTNNYDIDYKTIKLKTAGQKKIIELLMMTLSGVLFSINIYYPFIINLIIYIFVLTMIVFLPKVEITRNELSLSRLSMLLVKKIVADKRLVREIIFYSIITTVLIINFDYYNVIFMRNHISKELYGLIYASFMLINYLGIKMFNKKKVNHLEKFLFFCLPVSFVLVTIKNLCIIAIAIFLQQLVYSYIFIRFDLYIIDYVKEITQGTHFQSLISFWYSIFKAVLLFIISILLKYFDLFYLYYLIAIVLLVVIYLYKITYRNTN